LQSQEDLILETIDNIKYARYDSNKIDKNLIMEADCIEIAFADEEQNYSAVQMFFNPRFLTIEKEVDDLKLIDVRERFKEKVARNGTAFSLATNYVSLSLFNDIPITTWFSDRVATAYCLLLNQRESALRKILLNKRPKILFLDQTFLILQLTEWTSDAKQCRFQMNTDDCGVYMLLFSYVLPDFPYEIVKSINMKLARLKIGMDITRGYIEDPRLEGYEYNNNDATKPGLLAIPPFNYERFMLD
jgi:hypothetical protein